MRRTPPRAPGGNGSSEAAANGGEGAGVRAEGLEGRGIWIVGGSRGIGYACATDFLKAGYKVVLSSRNEERLLGAKESLRELTGFMPEVVPVDSGSRRSVAVGFDGVRGLLGRVYGVVVSGASPAPGGLEGLGEEGWQEALNGKLLGQIRVASAVVPHMVAQGGGRVVHVVGTHGLQPEYYALAAGVVNAALLNFVKALGREVSKDNVLVNAVNPGPIDTDRMSQLTAAKAAAYSRGGSLPEAREYLASDTSLGRFGRPEEVAGLVTWLISDAASYCTGSYYNVDGGQVRGV